MKVCILLKLVFTELLDVFMLKNIVEGNTLLRIKYEDQCEEAEGIGIVHIMEFGFKDLRSIVGEL